MIKSRREKVSNVTFILIYTFQLMCVKWTWLAAMNKGSEKVNNNVIFTLIYTLRLNMHKNELHKNRKKVKIMSPLLSFTHFS